MTHTSRIMFQTKKQLIVSRHAGALEWLRRRGFDVSAAKAEITAADVDRNTVIVGNVPLALAAKAAAVVAIQFKGAPPRGTEYTADDMEAAGAYLQTYWVAETPTLDAESAAQSVWNVMAGRLTMTECLSFEKAALLDSNAQIARWWWELAKAAEWREWTDALASTILQLADIKEWIPDAAEIVYYVTSATPEDIRARLDGYDESAYAGDHLAEARAQLVRWCIQKGLTAIKPEE